MKMLGVPLFRKFQFLGRNLIGLGQFRRNADSANAHQLSAPFADQAPVLDDLRGKSVRADNANHTVSDPDLLSMLWQMLAPMPWSYSKMHDY
jgi:hypothetical protein